MNNPDNIRNISVIAHVDHGKTTLTSSLIARAGITAENNTDFLDFGELEKEKGITIKSTGVSLYHEIEEKGVKKQVLINVIDSPGHVDFSSEVTAALRVTDGALVVVDTVEGVCVQTETVLRQAMAEKIRPILMINKVDRAIHEQQLDGEAIYQQFVKVIDLVNVIISNYESPDMGELIIDPVKGNVCFGTGKDCWGFNLRKFARMYAQRFNTEEDRLVTKLWGDNYFDQEAKIWTDEPISETGKPLKRGFVQFIIEPIIKLTKTLTEGTEEQIKKSLETIKITLDKDEKELKGKHLCRAVLSKWINCPDTLLEMIITNLPSPKVAQKYRAAYLYESDPEDPCYKAIRDCDANGPLMVYISKMIPNGDYSRFIAFGRVFSGTVHSGQKVRIMGPNYVPGSKEDIALKAIQRTVMMMGKNVEYITDVPCGNTVGLTGIDQYLMKTGTISDHEDSHNIRVMKYSVSPVVRVAVAPKNPQDLPKFIEGLTKLSKSDTLLQVIKEETGQYIIAGCGELHIEIALHSLEKEYAKVPIIVSEPVVGYKETIRERFDEPVLSKSSNKHNRLFVTAEPMSEELVDAIERGEIGPNTDPKVRSKVLSEQFDWNRDEALKLWTFGLENSLANVLVDMTSGIQYMNEIRDSVQTAFHIVTKEGVLCGENMRKIRFNIHDAKIHSDQAHRGSGQIIEMARRVMYASELSGKPGLQEPVFQADITVPIDSTSGVYNCLSQRRGEVIDEEIVQGSPLAIIKAYLPVSESFGFTEFLRSNTGGRAFPQCVFHHWDNYSGDPLDETSKAFEIVKTIRKRKGMKEELPTLAMYADKM